MEFYVAGHSSSAYMHICLWEKNGVFHLFWNSWSNFIPIECVIKMSLCKWFVRKMKEMPRIGSSQIFFFFFHYNCFIKLFLVSSSFIFFFSVSALYFTCVLLFNNSWYWTGTCLLPGRKETRLWPKLA